MKFNCKGCGKILLAVAEDSGKESECPKCGKALKVPFPGIGIAAFWGYWLLIGIVGGLASGATGGLLLPVAVAFHMYVKYLRVINIGLHPAWMWFGLVPFISTIWFGVSGTGSVKRKAI